MRIKIIHFLNRQNKVYLTNLYLKVFRSVPRYSAQCSTFAKKVTVWPTKYITSHRVTRVEKSSNRCQKRQI